MTDKSADPPSNKTFDNCHKPKEIKEFLKNNKVLVWCKSCRNKRKISLLNKSTNQKHDTIVTYSDINDNAELVISFDVELSFFISIILDKDDKKNFDNNEKLYLEVAYHTAKSIEEDNDYK
ncbi:1575_t:CDS:2 [Gigaspora rosea]|nr:1575_t:CDS:2 [Gigaspora rosea]